jgi:hypothetical protein
MSTEREYVGKGVKAEKFDLINISISKSKIDDHWFEYNGEHYLKLTVGGLREKDQYGKTHSVWINDYKPNEGQPTAVKKAPVGEVQDLPF